MKCFIIILTALFFLACGAAPKTKRNAALDDAIIEKNKQTALLNEVGKTVEDAQSIEKLGRNMNSYRLATAAASRRTCKTVMEDNQREIINLEIRIKKLPTDYQAQFSAIITDLNECVTCSNKAMDSCVNARASINKIIKEIYPQ